MGKTILTPKQSQFLEYVSKDKQITERFYLTGGTALSEFYLQHRLSYDIDLFTEKQEVNQKLTEAFLKKISKGLKIEEIKRSRDYLDLYLIMKKYGYSLDELIMAAKAKFDWHIDRMTLASQFIKATDFDESSMMIIPFEKKGMDNFFLSLAKDLKEEIFK